MSIAKDLQDAQKQLDYADRRVRTARALIGKQTLAISDFTDPTSPFWFDDQVQHSLNTVLMAGLKNWEYELKRCQIELDLINDKINASYGGGS